ncbi:MAG TPA: nuclear transport factor 2 family protein, partial [Anaeromyxobacteraceae bacterium]|nr:nuclear transport factor 2 family protein [Anaeromyxobacteraceae bacterium]
MEVVRSSIAAFNAHDMATWLGSLGSDFEFVDHMGAVGEGDASGKQQIRRLIESWLEAFPDFQAET